MNQLREKMQQAAFKLKKSSLSSQAQAGLPIAIKKRNRIFESCFGLTLFFLSQADFLSSAKAQAPLNQQTPPNQQSPLNNQIPNFKPVSPEQNESTKTNKNSALNRKRTNDPDMRGANSFYGRTGFGFTNTDSSICDPALVVCNPPQSENKFALFSDILFGWGPLRFDQFYLTPYYQYQHNWASGKSQFDEFLKNWFKTKKAGDFIFPTKSFLRTHNTALDFRYLLGDFQLGWFAKLSIGRLGSTLFADKENLEETKTVLKSELFVPYLTYKFRRYYRAQLYFPLETEVNLDEPRYSFSTYSFSGSGRGRFFSTKLNNVGYIDIVKTFVNLDIFLLTYKYSAISLDRKKSGFSLGVDAPVYWQIRLAPKYSLSWDTYDVKRVRIPGYDKSPSGDKNAPGELQSRKDSFEGYGMGIYWDFLNVNRFSFDLSYEKTNSTIIESSQTNLTWKICYVYSFPKTSTVLKRTQRFQDSTYAEEF